MREPNSHMNEAVSFQNAAPREIGDFQLIIHLRRISAVGFDGARVVVVGIHRPVVGKQRMALEADRLLQLRCYHVA